MNELKNQLQIIQKLITYSTEIKNRDNFLCGDEISPSTLNTNIHIYPLSLLAQYISGSPWYIKNVLFIAGWDLGSVYILLEIGRTHGLGSLYNSYFFWVLFCRYGLMVGITLYNHEVTALLPHKRSPEINKIIIILWLRSIFLINLQLISSKKFNIIN